MTDDEYAVSDFNETAGPLSTKVSVACGCSSTPRSRRPAAPGPRSRTTSADGGFCTVTPVDCATALGGAASGISAAHAARVHDQPWRLAPLIGPSRESSR